MTDYVLIEGDLDEILEYNIEQAQNREEGFHCDIASIKEDHAYEICGLCNMTVEASGRFFKMLARDARSAIRYMEQPIHVGGKQI